MTTTPTPPIVQKSAAPAAPPPALEKPNPASTPPAEAAKADPAQRRRIPMSVPIRRLELPELPGWHLHWFREINVARAMQAAYQFVESDEVLVSSRSIATDSELSGNADLGTRVRVHSGVTELNHPEYLVLMKLKEEFWDEDRRAFDQANANRLAGIFKNEQIMDPAESPVGADDKALRYVKTAVFNRPTRKARTVT